MSSLKFTNDNKRLKQILIKMSEELSKSGLYIDDFYMLRVLEPDIANETNDLKDESSNFGESNDILIGF